MDALGETLKAALAVLVERGWIDADHTFYAQLCLEEALVNAITHGNANDPRKRVTVRVYCASECWGVEIADEGLGFDWKDWARRLDDGINVAQPTGRGLALILRSGARVEFLDGGRTLRMFWMDTR